MALIIGSSLGGLRTKNVQKRRRKAWNGGGLGRAVDEHQRRQGGKGVRRGSGRDLGGERTRPSAKAGARTISCGIACRPKRTLSSVLGHAAR